MRLLLIRHGQTLANVEGKLDTEFPGPGLTSLGRRQAAEIPRALAGEAIDAIFVSTLIRTHLTAAPLAEARSLPAVELPGVHEIEAGELEKRSDRDSIRRYLEVAFAWGLGQVDVRMPGSHDGRAFFQRFDRDIARVAECDSAVVFSHGAAIRVWVAARATNVPPSFAGAHEIENTGVVELTGSPEAGWTLLSWQGTPVGGARLSDSEAPDPTGETLRDAGAHIDD